MQTKWLTGLTVILTLLGTTGAWAQRYSARDVEVEIINDRGRPFPQYPLRRDSGSRVYKAHLEAARNSNYSIRIRNGTNERIGVVVAVDGRNIITGERSNLRPNERMYVLNPRQDETYEGWRTGRNRVNRFYFTEAGDSYAGAWGDFSAMGVIAVAAFREAVSYPPPPPPRSQPEDRGYQSSPGGERGLQRAPGAPAAEAQRSQPAPGTGYGETEWSPSRRVEFEAERRPFAQAFLKYAWRDTLCREGVIDCERGGRPPRNRFWDEEDYAPPPPDYDRYNN